MPSLWHTCKQVCLKHSTFGVLLKSFKKLITWAAGLAWVPCNILCGNHSCTTPCTWTREPQLRRRAGLQWTEILEEEEGYPAKHHNFIVILNFYSQINFYHIHVGIYSMVNFFFPLHSLAAASVFFLNLNILRRRRCICTCTRPLHGSSLGFRFLSQLLTQGRSKK